MTSGVDGQRSSRFTFRRRSVAERSDRRARRISCWLGRGGTACRPDWLDRMSAVGAVCGVTVNVVDATSKSRIEDELHAPGREPAAVLVWRSRLDAPRVAAQLPELLAGEDPIWIDEWDLDPALEEARTGPCLHSDRLYSPLPRSAPKPVSGIHYYKKSFSTRNYDVMRRVGNTPTTTTGGGQAGRRHARASSDLNREPRWNGWSSARPAMRRLALECGGRKSMLLRMSREMRFL